MSEKKIELIEIKLKDLESLDFDSKELRDEFEDVKKRNEALIESTKIDTDSLSRKFEV